MIDVNVYLSRWPARRLPGDETVQLVDKLRGAGIQQAWAGSFDALLHKDIAAVNQRLADECRDAAPELLVPFGSVNPTLPDWQEDLRRCVEVHRMPGVRLHPNYHGYTLDDPRFAELLDLAERSHCLVQLAVRMEDDRTQHPLLRVLDVDTAPLMSLLSARPGTRLVLLNALRTLRPDMLGRLTTAGQVYVELSMQEGIGGVERLLQTVPLERILLGSYFPFFYLEAALLKLQESELAGFQLRGIGEDNARQLLAAGRG